MIRTQMQLSEEKYLELKKVAEREHRSMADCIREAIDFFLERSRRSSHKLSEIAGAFQPTPPDEPLNRHDTYWAESIDR